MKFLLLFFCLTAVGFQAVTAQSSEQKKSTEWLKDFFRKHPLYDPQTDEGQTDSTAFRRIFRYLVDGIHDSLEIKVVRISRRTSTGRQEIDSSRQLLRWQDIYDRQWNEGYPEECKLILFNDRHYRTTVLPEYLGSMRNSTSNIIYIHVRLELPDNRPFKENLTSLVQSNQAARQH
jgi:hypothetical protein